MYIDLRIMMIHALKDIQTTRRSWRRVSTDVPWHSSLAPIPHKGIDGKVQWRMGQVFLCWSILNEYLKENRD
jgi:hypothetical protein